MTSFEKFGREFMTYSNSRWRKWAFKAPLVLWRMGLGPLMGHIFCLLTMRGRKSGEPRHFLTEYYREDEKLYVVCAYGEKAQWYKNLMADPHVTVQTWKGAKPMKATRVSDGDEILRIMDGFRKRDPLTLRWYLDAKGIDMNSAEDILAHKDEMYILRLDPTDEPTPLPMDIDLAWIWPLLMLLRSRRRRKKRRKARNEA